jgi:DNA-binding CsgD family transcriptional regulator
MADNSDGPDKGGSTVRALLDRARDAGRAAGLVSDDIVGSWRRSAGAGLRPEMFEVPFEADVDGDGRLARAANPVVVRLGDDLSDTSVGLVLTDARGLVVSRRAADRSARELFDRIQLAPGFLYGEDRIGTNAIGTALERRAPTFVKAEEHFADALTRMACAAATITDPVTGRVVGVIDLSCATDDANPLMLPLAKRAVWEIEQRLLDDSSGSEPLIREHFLKARRTTRGPVVAISERALLLNGAASNLLEPTDHDRLWECVLPVLRGNGEWFSFALGNGNVLTFRCHPIADGPLLVGGLLVAGVTQAAAAQTSGLAPVAGLVEGRLTPQRRATDVGWVSLTEAERAVASHVSRGLTNREVAGRLFVSPHTVDFHLRQLFRKLDVSSRVELTRVVMEQASRPGP